METCPTPRGHKTLHPLPMHGVMANCFALPLHKFRPLLRKGLLFSRQSKSHMDPRMHFPSRNTPTLSSPHRGPCEDALGYFTRMPLGAFVNIPMAPALARTHATVAFASAGPPLLLKRWMAVIGSRSNLPAYARKRRSDIDIQRSINCHMNRVWSGWRSADASRWKRWVTLSSPA